MALHGIGGGNESALERFQAIRDLAKKKLDGADGQANLAELIKRKQAQIGSGTGSGIGNGSGATPFGTAVKPLAERIPLWQTGPSTSGNAAAAALSAPSGYGRSGSVQKLAPKPTLGQNVDFMA